MAVLKTVNGTEIISDDEDVAVASEFVWRDKGGPRPNRYGQWCPATNVMIDGKKKTLFLHRLLMGAQFGDGRILDHANGNTFDARKRNLRFCSASQNVCNQRNRSKRNKSSRFHGVYRHGKKWRAQIRINHTKVDLGVFLNEEDAARAYNAAAFKLHGEFASPNKI